MESEYMGNGLSYWKCNTCGTTATYQGLCRDCTTYDSERNIIEPTSRIRINKDGTQHVKNTQRPIMPFGERDGFRKQKKLTKKQTKAMEEHISKFRPTKDGEVALLGESDDEEE